MKVTVLVLDSVVKLPPEANGAVVIGGSHAAVYAAHMSAKSGCPAAIHHDAGIGKDEVGASGLAYADKLGMAMAAVATVSARIGDGRSTLQDGTISTVNRPPIGWARVWAARRLPWRAPWPTKPGHFGRTAGHGRRQREV